MGDDDPFGAEGSTGAALAALSRGYQAVPIRDGQKRPMGTAWTHTRWETTESVRSAFDRWRGEGASGIGLLLGKHSNGLVDVDVDHAKALGIADIMLPPTAMQTGHAGRPRSHYWYRVTDDVPDTRQYKMPGGAMAVELRSTGAQTLIPPTVHPSGEPYRWEGEPWGGEEGPRLIKARELSMQVAYLALGTVLVDRWPDSGGRHEAYLALAGGLLWYGTDNVHPFWEERVPRLIEGLALATHDRDGGATRVAEVVRTTVERLRRGDKTYGWNRLGQLTSPDHADMAQRLSKEMFALAGGNEQIRRIEIDVEVVEGSALPKEDRNPMEERTSSWAAVDLEPYISGRIVLPDPTILVRSDGRGLMYPGRVNSLFGLSESAKSWVAMYAGVQEMANGGRLLFVDLEDTPEGAVDRLRRLGAADDDLPGTFRYVQPEGPLVSMQRNRFGPAPTEEGMKNEQEFQALLKSFNPTLIVVDGMTVLYGLHGQDTNGATDTEVITGWLKRLCNSPEGRRTVIIIDHTGKAGGKGSSPIGSGHKKAMVQGVSLRVDVERRPMPGALGVVRLVTYKDRIGRMIRHLPPSELEKAEPVAAVLTLDSREEGVTRMRLDPPEGLNPGEFEADVTDEDIEKAQRASAAELKRREAQRKKNEVLDKAVELASASPTGSVSAKEVCLALGLPPGDRMTSNRLNDWVSAGALTKTGTTTDLRYRPVTS